MTIFFFTWRELEPIRLLGLQFIGKLLVGVPSDKKGSKLFSLGMQRAKSISESPIKGNTRIEPIFSAIADRLFNFPQTDHLSAMLFDVLLGGASPKQVGQLYMCDVLIVCLPTLFYWLSWSCFLGLTKVSSSWRREE